MQITIPGGPKTTSRSLSVVKLRVQSDFRVNMSVVKVAKSAQASELDGYLILKISRRTFQYISNKMQRYTVWLCRNTNKIQLCNRIYYSKVYWRLNMFRAAHRSSPGALNCICSLWFIYPCGDRPLPRLIGKWIHFSLSLSNDRSPHVYINQRLQIQFTAPDDERCAARNMFSLQ